MPKKLQSYRTAHTKKPKASVQRIKKRRVTKGGRGSDPAKIAWLHTLACLIFAKWPLDSECGGKTEVHHHRPHGAAATDARTVPLCTAHHRTGPRSLAALGRRGFQNYHAVDLDNECAFYENNKPK